MVDQKASELCGDVTWSNDFEELSDDCGATGSATVTFTATDDCGNSSSSTATFTIEDTIAPSLDITSFAYFAECDGEGNIEELQEWLDNQGGAKAHDTCSEVTWTNNFEGLTDDCGATGSAQVTFIASDECGNTVSTTATFYIVDKTPPVISDAMDMTVECDGGGNMSDLQAWLDNNAGSTATDLCGDVAWSNNYDSLSDGCGATGSATVTFTATDECGNTAETSATFTIEDTTDPEVMDAMDMTVECDGEGNVEALNEWLASNGGASATDTCGNCYME